MIKVLYFLSILTTGFTCTFSCAQNPSYFQYDNEKGLPSDEVYSIVQDNDGMIWIGCEAGLFKFDGFRYHPYRSKNEKSRSLTNLRVSTDGRVFCLNFKSQLFHTVEKSSQLVEIKHPFQKIRHFDISNDGVIFVSHKDGLAKKKLNSNEWQEVSYPEFSKETQTGSVEVVSNNQVNFLTPKGLGQIINGRYSFIKINEKGERLCAEHLMTSNKKSSWIFSFRRSEYYKVSNGIVSKNERKTLNTLIHNRKITNVQLLDTNHLWISTFKGCILYNINKDEGRVFFSDKAISKVFRDREGNHWFTTLQSGILRVPTLDFLVWNTDNAMIKNNQLTNITEDSENIYFSDINGHIGILNKETREIKSLYTGFDANIESIYFNKYKNELLIYSQYRLKSYKDGKINQINKAYASVKKILTTSKRRYLATSTGLHVEHLDSEKSYVFPDMFRDISFDSISSTLWLASNEGLLVFEELPDTTRLIKKMLHGVLIVDVEHYNDSTYVLTYDGKIILIDEDHLKQIYQIPKSYQGSKFIIRNNSIYIISNKGLLIYNTKVKNVNILNRVSGLSSNNIQDMILSDNCIWLASGRGLQKLPLNLSDTSPRALVSIDSKRSDHFQISHDEPFKIKPQASSYKSNGDFNYAYRINQKEWIELPGSIEEIILQNLPLRNIQIELKVIDHLGRNSQNTVLLNGYVYPPIYLTWWFLLIVFVIAILFIIFFVRKRISTIKKRQNQKNALLNSQLKAIRAQMNPHFMYNTLNSIQDLILQNDIKRTNYYLSKFSQLMRQILSFSEEEKILLSEELDMLKNYLSLEKLRFGDDFKFNLEIDKSIDLNRTVIPSLIIQPFIENAIKHGLLHKKGIKKLEIHFNYVRKIEDLKVTISDNGIGRKHSTEINKRSNLNHKSFASNAVQKRIELLNKGKEFTVDLNIEDLVEGSHSKGTVVTLKILRLKQES